MQTKFQVQHKFKSNRIQPNKIQTEFQDQHNFKTKNKSLIQFGSIIGLGTLSIANHKMSWFTKRQRQSKEVSSHNFKKIHHFSRNNQRASSCFTSRKSQNIQNQITGLGYFTTNLKTMFYLVHICCTPKFSLPYLEKHVK